MPSWYHTNMDYMDFLKNPAVFYSALLAFILAVIFDLYMRTRKIKKDANQKVSGHMEEALLYLKEDPSTSLGARKTRKKITNDQYQELTGVSHATATRDLQKLEEFGLLEQKGSGRGIYYQLTKT